MTQFAIVALAADSQFSASFTAADAGDGRFTGLSGERWSSASGAFPHWLRADLGTPRIVTWYRLDPGRAGNDPTNWTLEGTNNSDFTSWITLDTRSQASGRTRTQTYQISNSFPFRWYRINISSTDGGSTGGSGGSTSIAEFELGNENPHAVTNEHRAHGVNQANNSRIGYTLVVNSGITVTHVVPYVANINGTFIVEVRDESGAIVATGSYVATTSDPLGPREVALTTPIDLNPGTYRVEQYGAGRALYVSSSYALENYGVNGEVTIPATGTVTFRGSSSTTVTSNGAGNVEPTVAFAAIPVHGIRFVAPQIVTSTGSLQATGPIGSALITGTVTDSGTLTAVGPLGEALLEGGEPEPVGSTGTLEAVGPVGSALILGANPDGASVQSARVSTPSAIRALITLVPATPPASLKLIPIQRRSHVMAPLSAEHPEHSPHGDCEFGDNEVIVEDVGIPHLFIGGRDVTFWRGRLTEITSWESEAPFGDTVAAFAFPQMNPWDKPGEGDLDFLVADADVVIGIDDGENFHREWSGFLDANGLAMAETEEHPWEAKGTLWQAMHDVHEPRPFTEPIDIWVLAARTLNSVKGRTWAYIPETPIGITTLNRGSRDQFKFEYVQDLMSEAIEDDGRLWSIHEPMPGVFRPILKPAATEVHATVAYGTPGVDINLRIDESTRVDGFFARAIGLDEGGWANMHYPGAKLMQPLPYPNLDFRNINIGTTDADTDSGSGVSDWQRRMNEIRSFGHLDEDGVFGTRDSAVLFDAQEAWDIEADGSLGPQSWNRTFKPPAAGIDLTPLRLPLVMKNWVWPTLHDAHGVELGPNPNYDPKPKRRLVPIDLGSKKSKTAARAYLRRLMKVYGTAAAAGTIRWENCPNEVARTQLTHLRNVEVRGHFGADRVVQIVHKSVELDAGSDDSPRQYVITTRVDERARDAMAVEDIFEQRRSATPDPARRPSNPNRSSRAVDDQRIPWDSESICGVLPRTAINGAAGLPSSIWLPFAEVGKLAEIELFCTQPFALLMVASLRLTENRAQAIVGDPFSQPDPFRSKFEELEQYGPIEGWGEKDDACGYSPMTEPDGKGFKGRFLVRTPVDYWSETIPMVNLLIWMRGASGAVWGRFRPAYEGN